MQIPKLQKNKKGVSGGLITGLVMGVAGLVVLIIIAFVITSTLSNADLLTSGRASATVNNETGGYINQSGYTLNAVGGNNVGFSIVRIWNGTTNLIIASGNYTLNSASGVLTNITTTNWEDVNITYNHQIKADEEIATDFIVGNFTSGIDNISAKIPTVLLIAAIVLILGVLVFLVIQWQRMRFGGGSASL